MLPRQPMGEGWLGVGARGPQRVNALQKRNARETNLKMALESSYDDYPDPFFRGHAGRGSWN